MEQESKQWSNSDRRLVMQVSLKQMTVRHLKKGAGRKMTKTGTSKQLLDDCLELKTDIYTNTALDTFMLGGGVSKMCCLERHLISVNFVSMAGITWLS